MKKLVFLLAFIFALSGCSNIDPVSASEIAEKYSNSFSAKANAIFGENNAEIEIEKNPMSISVFVVSPKEAAGLSVEIYDEHAKVKYNGIEQDINPENLPSGAVFLLIEDLFDDLENADGFTLSTENGEIKIFSEDFSAALSPEDFSIISADFPEYKTRFEFSEFVFNAP